MTILRSRDGFAYVTKPGDVIMTSSRDTWGRATIRQEGGGSLAVIDIEICPICSQPTDLHRVVPNTTGCMVVRFDSKGGEEFWHEIEPVVAWMVCGMEALPIGIDFTYEASQVAILTTGGALIPILGADRTLAAAVKVAIDEDLAADHHHI